MRHTKLTIATQWSIYSECWSTVTCAETRHHSLCRHTFAIPLQSTLHKMSDRHLHYVVCKVRKHLLTTYSRPMLHRWVKHHSPQNPVLTLSAQHLVGHSTHKTNKWFSCTIHHANISLHHSCLLQSSVGTYKHPKELWNDVMLIVGNARKYAPKGTKPHTNADSLQVGQAATLTLCILQQSWVVFIVGLPSQSYLQQ